MKHLLNEENIDFLISYSFVAFILNGRLKNKYSRLSAIVFNLTTGYSYARSTVLSLKLTTYYGDYEPKLSQDYENLFIYATKRM